MSDGVKLETAGVPTVTVCSDAFAGAARRQAAGRGMADLPVIEVPHPMHTAPKAAVTARAEAAVQQVVQALTQRAAATKTAVVPRLADTLELDADPDALQVFFHDQGWSDG